MNRGRGEQWSNHSDDDDELESLRPHSESGVEDEPDEAAAAAAEAHAENVRNVKLRRAAHAEQKVRTLLSRAPTESRDVKMTNNDKAPEPATDAARKKPAWGNHTAGNKQHPDVRYRAGTEAASSDANIVDAGTAAEETAAAAPPTGTTAPTETDANDGTNTTALTAEEQAKQDEIIAEVRKQKHDQHQQQQQNGAAFNQAGAAIQSTKNDLQEAYQRMQAAQAFRRRPA